MFATGLTGHFLGEYQLLLVDSFSKTSLPIGFEDGSLGLVRVRSYSLSCSRKDELGQICMLFEVLFCVSA